MTDNNTDVNNDIRDKALQRLVELAKPERELIEYPDGRVYRNDGLIAEYPDYFEGQWFNGKLNAPAKCWERWYEHHYFTEEQKKELGLTDKDIGRVRG